jgi:hypothetical protein
MGGHHSDGKTAPPLARMRARQSALGGTDFRVAVPKAGASERSGENRKADRDADKHKALLICVWRCHRIEPAVLPRAGEIRLIPWPNYTVRERTLSGRKQRNRYDRADTIARVLRAGRLRDLRRSIPESASAEGVIQRPARRNSGKVTIRRMAIVRSLCIGQTVASSSTRAKPHGAYGLRHAVNSRPKRTTPLLHLSGPSFEALTDATTADETKFT